MSGFSAALQGIPSFGILAHEWNKEKLGVTPISPSGFTGAQVHGQLATEPAVSATSSGSKPLVIDPAYAPFNKDSISGTEGPCSFSGRGLPICGSKEHIAGSKAMAKREAAKNVPIMLLAGAAVIGFLLLR